MSSPCGAWMMTRTKCMANGLDRQSATNRLKQRGHCFIEKETILCHRVRPAPQGKVSSKVHQDQKFVMINLCVNLIGLRSTRIFSQTFLWVSV